VGRAWFEFPRINKHKNKKKKKKRPFSSSSISYFFLWLLRKTKGSVLWHVPQETRPPEFFSFLYFYFHWKKKIENAGSAP
jgi:hypothetical protein